MIRQVSPPILEMGQATIMGSARPQVCAAAPGRPARWPRARAIWLPF